LKKINVALLVLTLLITPYAQAKYCYGFSCNYIENGGFGSNGLYWSYANGVTFPTENVCYGSTVAELENTEWIQQQFYVDDTFSSFSVNFRTYLINDTNNFYDQLKVIVTNLDTNVSETYQLNGSSYNTTCNLHTFNLSNNYSNANVMVRFEVAYLSLGKYQIDDVAFWAAY
jgi:hypothetical protein